MLLEAAASGVPIITARTAGGCEVLDSTAAEILEDPNDVSQLAAAMRKLIDVPERGRRRPASLPVLSRSMSWESMSRAYVGTFRCRRATAPRRAESCRLRSRGIRTGGIRVLSDASPKILAIATKGSGTNEERRCALSCRSFRPNSSPSTSPKTAERVCLFKTLLQTGPTRRDGRHRHCGRRACPARADVRGVRFVVSSGDAVAPFVAAIHPILGPAFAMYRACSVDSRPASSAGPRISPAAGLRWGLPPMTAAGWGVALDPANQAGARARLRWRLGIGEDTLVFGILGALVWNSRLGYCYGAELIPPALRPGPLERRRRRHRRRRLRPQSPSRTCRQPNR